MDPQQAMKDLILDLNIKDDERANARTNALLDWLRKSGWVPMLNRQNMIALLEGIQRLTRPKSAHSNAWYIAVLHAEAESGMVSNPAWHVMHINGEQRGMSWEMAWEGMKQLRVKYPERQYSLVFMPQ